MLTPAEWPVSGQRGQGVKSYGVRGEACCILHPAYPGCPFFTHTKLSKHFLFSAIKNCSHAPPRPASSPPTPSPPSCCCCSCCGSNVGRNFCCVALPPSPSLSLSLLERASHNRQLHTQPVAAPRSIDPSTEGAGERQGGGGEGTQGEMGAPSLRCKVAAEVDPRPFFGICIQFFCPAAPRVLFRISRYFSCCCFARTPVPMVPFSAVYPSTCLSALSDCLTLSTPLQSMHHHMISFYYKITGPSSNSHLLHVPSLPPPPYNRSTCNHRLQSIDNSLKLQIYILHLSDLFIAFYSNEQAVD